MRESIIPVYSVCLAVPLGSFLSEQRALIEKLQHQSNINDFPIISVTFITSRRALDKYLIQEPCVSPAHYDFKGKIRGRELTDVQINTDVGLFRIIERAAIIRDAHNELMRNIRLLYVNEQGAFNCSFRQWNVRVLSNFNAIK